MIADRWSGSRAVLAEIERAPSPARKPAAFEVSERAATIARRLFLDNGNVRTLALSEKEVANLLEGALRERREPPAPRMPIPKRARIVGDEEWRALLRRQYEFDCDLVDVKRRLELLEDHK